MQKPKMQQAHYHSYEKTKKKENRRKNKKMKKIEGSLTKTHHSGSINLCLFRVIVYYTEPFSVEQCPLLDIDIIQLKIVDFIKI